MAHRHTCGSERPRPPAHSCTELSYLYPHLGPSEGTCFYRLRSHAFRWSMALIKRAGCVTRGSANWMRLKAQEGKQRQSLTCARSW